MNLSDVTPRRVALAVGYLVFGAVGTLAAGIVGLRFLQPIQPHVYRVFYLAVGPWDATATARIFHFALAGLLAIGLPVLVVETVRGRVDDAPRAAVGLGVVLALLAGALSVTAFLGILDFLTVLLVFAVVVAGMVAALHRYDASPAGVVTFAGGLPVLALLLLLLGFGLGWGGGVSLAAEAVDDGGASPTASLDEVPAVRDDLFAASSCDPYDEGVCRLELRGYEHDAAVARFLADHGARCPFPGTGADGGSVLVEHEGTHYRLWCESYGD